MYKKFFILLVLNLFFSTYFFNIALAKEWHYKVGLAYQTGISDIGELWEKNKYEIYGHNNFDKIEFPFGIFIEPYYKINNIFNLGVGIGPSSFVLGDMEYWDIPISLIIEYKMLPMTKTIFPFFKTGLKYHIVDGDYVEGSEIGLLLGCGFEVHLKKQILGLEMSYDTSEIEYTKSRCVCCYETGTIEKIKASELIISVFARF